MKVSTRLTLLFLTISLVPLLAISYLAYLNGIKTIKQDTFDRLTSVNDLKADEVSRWINSSRSFLQALAQRPLVRLYASQLLDKSTSGSEIQPISKKLLDDHFIPAISYDTGLLDLSIISSQTGKIIASTNQLLVGRYRNNRSFFEKGKKTTYVDSMSYELGVELLTMHISTPLKGENGRTIAVLAGHLDWQEMSLIMEQGKERSKTEESYLVNQFNYFVTESRFIAGVQLQKTIHTLGVERCLLGEEGVEMYDDYRSVPVIGAFRWMEKWNLCILTEEDRSEAFEPVVTFRKVYIVVGVVAAFVASLFSLFFARTITNRVTRLVNGAEEIGKGNLHYRLEIEGNDELDQLAGSFNDMAKARQKTEARIQKAHDYLEERVAERTTEISQKNIQLKEEINERNQAEIALRESEKKYKMLVDTLDAAVMVHGPDTEVVMSNRKSHELLGLTEAQLTGKQATDPIWHFTREDSTSLSPRDHPANVVQLTGNSLEDSILGIKHPDKDKTTWVSVKAFPEFDNNGEIQQIVVTFWDITLEKEAAEKLQHSLNEKEVLLREIHHRVKNNMQMIQSLINLQSKKIGSPQLKQRLVDSTNSRIKSMALVHETLYRSKDLASLEIDKYFRQLVTHLVKVYHKGDRNIEILYDVDQILLDMDSSIACGLIVNELVTNALKYAFHGRENNTLTIALNQQSSSEASLTVSDNGTGLPGKLEEITQQSLGLKIVDMLAVDQLHGSISVDTVAGTHFHIQFPI